MLLTIEQEAQHEGYNIPPELMAKIQTKLNQSPVNA